MAHRPRRPLLASLLASAVLLCATAASAATITLEPVRDNTLFDDATGARSNGEGMYLFAGRASGSDLGRARRALLAFDVAGSLPAGATIVAAALTLTMNRTISGARPMSIRRVLADWGEGGSEALGEEGMGTPAEPGDATWLHRFFGTDMLWAMPGGDFAAAASASRSVGGTGSYTWGPTAEMASDVQGWLDQPESNFGWILIGDEETQPSAKRFSSREGGATVRPRLEIEFESGTTPTETPAETSPTATVEQTGESTATPTESPTPSAIPTETEIAPTPTATATPTGVPGCAGDCGRDGIVSLAEIIRAVDVALRRTPLDACEAVDADADERVTIDELVRAVESALGGCVR